MTRPTSIYRLSCIEFSAWTSQMFLGLVRLLPAPSSARSAQMFLDSGIHPHSRRGWGYVRSNRSAGDEFSILKVDVSEIVLRVTDRSKLPTSCQELLGRILPANRPKAWPASD